MSNFISTTKLYNTRILVIGGTSGVGFGVARAALEHGASVILASSNPEKVAGAVAKLKELYPEEPFVSRIAGRKCDLGNEETIEGEVLGLLEFASAVDTFAATATAGTSADADADRSTGRVPINHIVFTAGSIPTDILPPTHPDITPEYLKSQNTNTTRFIGAALIAKHAATYMALPSSSSSSSASPSITLTSGVLITRPQPNLTYAIAAGAALEGLARGLAVDLAPIRVNVVRLGPVRTGLLDSIGDEETVGRIWEGHGGKTLLGRVGGVDEVAESYLGVVRDGFITGSVVGVDGGYLLK
ncbi:hypothetical protein BJX70DRAFT_400187 [Aspergillus crustosus]